MLTYAGVCWRMQARLRVLNSGGWPHATPGMPYDKSTPAAATSQVSLSYADVC
jgi:hypothetical protein